MNSIKKNQILTKFLQEISPPPAKSIATETLAQYETLGNALDFLETVAPPLINFDTIIDNPHDRGLLRDILHSCMKFNPGNPPTIQSFSESNLRERTVFWQRDQRLAGLPQNDFYNRQTRAVQSDEVRDLIAASRLKMKPLVESFLKAGSVFDPANDEHVQSIITQLQNRLKASAKGSPAYALTEKKMSIMEDLNKINKLAVISIPQEPNGSRNYCSLAESAGGVTKKVSLVSLDKVRTQLTHLTTAAPITSIDAYSTARANYKLSTEAILKLPKHGEIKEVQREAMALNVSRILGLDTTRSTMMTHNGAPALFVPFDNIKLLKNYAKGKTFKAAGFSGKTYEHYSTMNPVGRGLQPNTFVDDFGASLGLFYLCSDTDAVGAYNQNKALRDARTLFIFDQVIMSKDKLGLDSRLSMQPIEFMMKHTRHGQGRNRTLIEDSSFNNKFASLMELKQKQALIAQYASRVIHIHQIHIKQLENKLANVLSDTERKTTMTELKNLLALRDDAAVLRTSINDRIKKIDDVLPKHGAAITDIEVRQAMVLEKLVHNPVLFSSEGRPYRNPWTQRQDNTVKTITEVDATHVLIKFDSKIKEEMIAFIKRQGGANSLTIRSDKELVISRADLNQLNEAMLHPEFRPALNHHINYLDSRDLNLISKAYEMGHRGRIMVAVKKYQAIMSNGHSTSEEKLLAIAQTEKDIINNINTAKHPGFGLHVLKKFHYNVQQELQLIIPHGIKPTNLDLAFEAAVKLDRLGDFNQVIKKAIAQDRVPSPSLTKYLADCIALADPAVTRNHYEAMQRSSELMEAGRAAIAVFSQAPTTITAQNSSISADNELANISPIAYRNTEIQSELRSILGSDASPSVTVVDVSAKDIHSNTSGLVN